jgi:hypothetical protein
MVDFCEAIREVKKGKVAFHNLMGERFYLQLVSCKMNKTEWQEIRINGQAPDIGDYLARYEVV